MECQMTPVPLWPVMHFLVIAILSMDGRVRDRWRLDRAIVVDGNGRSEFAGDSDLGTVRM